MERVGRIWEAVVAGVAERQFELSRFPVVPGGSAPLAGVLGTVPDLAGNRFQVGIFLRCPLPSAFSPLAGERLELQRAVLLLDGEQFVVGESSLQPLVAFLDQRPPPFADLGCLEGEAAGVGPQAVDEVAAVARVKPPHVSRMA